MSAVARLPLAAPILALLLLLLLLPLLLTPRPVTAQDALSPEAVDGLVLAGRASYEQGAYGAAADAWRRAVDAGAQSPALYENLGSAYLAAGDPGRAALAFQRGLERAPREAGLREGLDRARAEAAAPAPVAPDTVGARWDAATRRWATTDELLFALWAGWGLALLAAYAAWRARARGPRALALTAALSGLGLLALAGASLLARDATESAAPRAIVLAPAEARPGPGEALGEGFTVAPASEARLLERQGRWLHVELAGSRDRGWLPRAVLAPIEAGRWPEDGEAGGE